MRNKYSNRKDQETSISVVQEFGRGSPNKLGRPPIVGSPGHWEQLQSHIAPKQRSPAAPSLLPTASLSLSIQAAIEHWISAYVPGQSTSQSLTTQICSLLRSFGLVDSSGGTEGGFLPAPKKRANTDKVLAGKIRGSKGSFSPPTRGKHFYVMTKTEKNCISTPISPMDASGRKEEDGIFDYLTAVISEGRRYVQKTEPFVLLSKDPVLLHCHSSFLSLLSPSSHIIPACSRELFFQCDSPTDPYKISLESSISRASESLSLSTMGDEKKGFQAMIGGVSEVVEGMLRKIAIKLRLYEDRITMLFHRLHSPLIKKLLLSKPSEDSAKDRSRMRLFETLYNNTQRNLMKLQQEITSLKARKNAVSPIESEMKKVKNEAAGVSFMLNLREKHCEETEKLRMTIEDLREKLRNSEETARKTVKFPESAEIEAKLRSYEEKYADLTLELVRLETSKEVEMAIKDSEILKFKHISADILSITAENRYQMRVEDLVSVIHRIELERAPFLLKYHKLREKVEDLEAEISVLGCENSFLNKECDDLKYGMSLYDTAKSIIGPDTLEKFKTIFADLQRRWEESFNHELSMREMVKTLESEVEAFRNRAEMVEMEEKKDAEIRESEKVEREQGEVG